MRRRAISILLLLSMVIYGGGVARALHHATAHGCSYGSGASCEIAQLFEQISAADHTGSCCHHGSHDPHAPRDATHHDEANASSHGSCDSSEDHPADHHHDHDCDTCEMLLKIAASVDRIPSHAFATTNPTLVVAHAPSLLFRRPALCSGGPRAPPTLLS